MKILPPNTKRLTALSTRQVLQALVLSHLDYWSGAIKEGQRKICKSDHDSILLLPSYRQKLKQEVPVLRYIQCWSDQWESMLQDHFDHADWDMFRVALRITSTNTRIR